MFFFFLSIPRYVPFRSVEYLRMFLVRVLVSNAAHDDDDDDVEDTRSVEWAKNRACLDRTRLKSSRTPTAATLQQNEQKFIQVKCRDGDWHLLTQSQK